MPRLTLSLLIAAVVAAPAVGEERVQFNRDIRSILSDKCFYCHGFDKGHREADLRLDTFDGATEWAVVPGEPDESEVIARVYSDDPDLLMPPPESEKHLTPEQKELLRRWIAQGAEYQEHWAWRALERPKAPGSVEKKPTGPAAIDAFLQAGTHENEAKQVGQATPRERLRRLSFDLRGLPPTADEVAAFEKSPTDEAFFSIRDRWMSELTYAEHQAVRWLDLVRWADTSGFVSDEPIASGAYRAWIIRAFAKNMPFDEFTRAQLAGDLLPHPTDDQLIASGYNRIVNTNCEAGGIEEEQLYKLKGEHVRAFGAVWLGMTTGCAECHDHKFDPFSAKDYYSLAAFFDDLVETGVYTPGDRREPLHYVYQDNSRAEDEKLVAQIQALREQIAEVDLAETKELERETIDKLGAKHSRSDFVWLPARLPAARFIEGGYRLVAQDGRFARETIAAAKELNRHHAAELMTGAWNPFPTDKKQDAWFVDVWLGKKDRPDMIALQLSNGDYGRVGWQPNNYETYYWGDDTSGELIDRHPWGSKRRVKRLGDLPEGEGWVRLRVPFADAIGAPFKRSGMAWLHAGGRVLWGDSGLELRRDKATAMALGETAVRKWWETPYNRQFYERRVEIVARAFKKPTKQRSNLEKELVADALRELARPGLVLRLRDLEHKLFALRSQAMPVLVSRQTENPKTTRLLNRGDYQDTSGPVMTPTFPSFIESDKQAGQAATLDRLDLANWLFDEAAPLVARVYVNRLWDQFYGRGLSETLEDSGMQGDWPSHVNLLDWLASEFRDSGWDRDHMVRLLTSTQAYQLDSKPTADLAERDPGNRWHARQGRFRLAAEGVRDSALHAAGLLQATSEIPVQSLFPYQPSTYWKRSDRIMYGSRHMIWATDQNEAQYRRTLYTFWKRQSTHPTMLAFDAPTRQECTARRNITNTPAQALALLNDPIFVEAARVLAERVCDNPVEETSKRLDRLFAITLQRAPSQAEASVLAELLSSQLAHFEANPEQAKQFTSIGQAPAPADNIVVEVAAWTVVTRTVLNLHEFVTRQ